MRRRCWPPPLKRRPLRSPPRKWRRSSACAHARRDSGQSRVVADFLLAWWNTGSCGAFDLTSLWALDTDIVADMTTVFGLIGRVHRYPDSLGYEAEFKAIVQSWRPELGD